jgi:hypothetical protein
VRALRRENRVGSIQPPAPQPRACTSSGRASKIAWRNPPRDAVDVTCKRNGGEHAWPFLRISRVLDISSAKRRCPRCIGCERTRAKRDGRPKNSSTDTGLSDVDISCDQSSHRQKLAAISEEIFGREVQGKTHGCCHLVTSEQSEVLPADQGRLTMDPHSGRRTSTQREPERPIVQGAPRRPLLAARSTSVRFPN